MGTGERAREIERLKVPDTLCKLYGITGGWGGYQKAENINNKAFRDSAIILIGNNSEG